MYRKQGEKRNIFGINSNRILNKELVEMDMKVS
jgi:hypothetical protein